jgi:alpha-glucosidase
VKQPIRNVHCSVFIQILLLIFCVPSLPGFASELHLASPDGKIILIVSDEGGLRYRVKVDGQPLLKLSRLGLEFAGGVAWGPKAKIEKVKQFHHDGTWENRYGKRRMVRDCWNQLQLTLVEAGQPGCRFGLILRAYDDGVAFRYDLPKGPGPGEFVLNSELTEFAFADDYHCWAGDPSSCAESQYPEHTLSAIPQRSGTKDGKSKSYKSVLPLLVQAPQCCAAVAESDLLDWAGMFITGTGSPTVGVTLASRGDDNGCVVSQAPRVSPWRVLMIGRTAGDLVNSDLIANLATPSQISNTAWIKPGVSAWDPWWTGLNPYLPEFRGVASHGNTRADEEYIDLAAEMGWSYQLVDWRWYQNCTSYDLALNLGGKNPERPLVDFARTSPDVDMPALLAHAKARGVRLILWLHSYDLERYGIEKACKLFSDWGVAGLKIDFMNSDSQETVAWYEHVTKTAAHYQLLIDFHGAYKPTGLARTWPNYITQEGVLGNEYNKLVGKKCTPLHTITLPFTRELLGPMDFTPGGFINRTVNEFKQTQPAEVMGTRARQLAMPVVYFSPLMVLCDSPTNYRGATGIEFYRNLPTVWDETVVLKAEIAKQIVIARRSGDRWWLAAMNGDEALKIRIPLAFLGGGKWIIRSFADASESATKPELLVEKFQSANASESIDLELAPAGGYAATLSKFK